MRGEGGGIAAVVDVGAMGCGLRRSPSPPEGPRGGATWRRRRGRLASEGWRRGSRPGGSPAALPGT